jgi:hypothetical protein
MGKSNKRYRRPGSNGPVAPGRGLPPNMASPKVPLEELPVIACGAEKPDGGKCLCTTFTRAHELRRVSALVSPAGRDGMAVIDKWLCQGCGASYTDVEMQGTSTVGGG